jgi:hypothetical protein
MFRFVATTATLRPCFENGLAAKLGVNSLPTFRSETRQRENLTFHLTRVCSQSEGLGILRHISKEAAQGKIIVFVRTKHEAECVGDWLRDNECPSWISYHSDVPDRSSLFADFIKCGRMVSTTCAGSGLNIDDLNTLVIFGDCYSAESCVQLAGRVGRQGQQASVHFVMYSRAIPGRQPKTFAEHEFHDLQSNSASGLELYNSCVHLVHSGITAIRQYKTPNTNKTFTSHMFTDARPKPCQQLVTLQEFTQFCHNMRVCLSELSEAHGCKICHLTNDDETQHVIQTCSWATNCCIICFQSGHGSATCSNKRVIVPQHYCSECLLPLSHTFGLHNDKWGLKCDGAGRHAFKIFAFCCVPKIITQTLRSRPTSTSPQLLRLRIALDEQIPKSLVRDFGHEYVKWLFDKSQRVPNILRILNCAFQTQFS